MKVHTWFKYWAEMKVYTWFKYWTWLKVYTLFKYWTEFPSGLGYAADSCNFFKEKFEFRVFL